jgi:sugar fermentation stimulation protein A
MISFGEVFNATLIKRPSKHIKSPYVGDILINGEEKLAHCPSLGLGQILKPDSKLLVTKSNENSKTDYIIQAVDDDGIWVGNVPLHANRLAKQIIQENKIIPNVGYVKPEYKMGESRLDFYVTDENDSEHFIEVKSVHIKDDKTALFPVGYQKKKGATVSERANKHVTHLTELSKKGKNCHILFVVQRSDCDSFRPYREKDPLFADLLDNAKDSGVTIHVAYCTISIEGIKITECKNY